MFFRLTGGPSLSHRGRKQNATLDLYVWIQNINVHWEGGDLESWHCFEPGGSEKQDPKREPEKCSLPGGPSPVQR